MVVWLPSARGVFSRSSVRVGPTEMMLDLDARGALKSLKFLRWGNPGGGAFGEQMFGVLVDEERSFGGYTIPSKVRAGWYFGTERFEREGEFFRATIVSADYK